jgi:hypothetical protein
MHKVFSLIILLGFSTVYSSLSDKTWEQCSESDFVINDSKVKYKFCTSSNEITSEKIDEQIIEDSKLIFDFVKTLGVVEKQCISNVNLEIYNVEFEVLNEKGRFSEWSNKSNLSIWALYDPRVGEPNTASIILSEHGESWNEILFAHELSHYWYDRYCWDKYEPNSEKFALDFEKYYSINRRK